MLQHIFINCRATLLSWQPRTVRVIRSFQIRTSHQLVLNNSSLLSRRFSTSAAKLFTGNKKRDGWRYVPKILKVVESNNPFSIAFAADAPAFRMS